MAGFFASPVLEPDGDVISWYSPVRGPVRPWSALNEVERRQAEGDVSGIGRELSDLVAAIRSRSSGGGALAEVIEQALRRPTGGDTLFLVGDQPVCVWWGFQDQLARVDAVAPTAYPPLPQWPQVAENERESVPLPPPQPAPPVAVAERSGVWRWLKWLLLVLLLLLLLTVFALRGCEQWPWGKELAPATQDPLITQRDAPQSIGPVPSLSPPSITQVDRVDLRPAGPLQSSGAEPVGPPAVQQQAPLRPGGISGSSPPGISEPASIALAPDEPPPRRPKSGDHIEIPKSAVESNRVDFIAGRYALGSERVLPDGTRGRFLNNAIGPERRDPQPVRVELEFAGDGSGKIAVTFVQAGGRCEGMASAEMSGGQLRIKVGAAACSGVPRRSQLSPVDVNCSVQSGRTLCSWVSSFGEKVSDVPLVHQ